MEKNKQPALQLLESVTQSGTTFLSKEGLKSISSILNTCVHVVGLQHMDPV